MNNETGEFNFDKDGHLCAGNVQLSDFIKKFVSQSESEIELSNRNELVPHKTRLQTPLVVYSQKRILYNLNSYKNAFGEELTRKHGIEVNISYSLKANFNPSILKLFHSNQTWVSLVNKNELKLALKMGFAGENLIFNGNGKKLDEIALALKSNCYVNIDSMFNLVDTLKVAKALDSEGSSLLPAKLLLRVNVSSTAQVHSYLDTSGQSKFGIEADRLDSIIDMIKSNSRLVRLAGFHIHLGSTIKTLDVFRHSVANLITLINDMMDRHAVDSIEIVNFGGGLGIDYERFAHRTNNSNSSYPICAKSKYPKPIDLAKLIGENVINLKLKSFKIIVEPGRSLVGDAAIILTSLIGVKHQENKNFLVVDASMCECIRPCLYSAYHHIDFVRDYNTSSSSVESSKQSESELAFDVVGPVCESGDFLGKNRHFRRHQLTSSSDDSPIHMAIMDVGAYCSSMASNYNLHQKPAEVFIDETESGARFLLTRRADTLEDILAPFIDF